MEQIVESDPENSLAFLDLVDNRVSLMDLAVVSEGARRSVVELEELEQLCKLMIERPDRKLAFRHRLYVVLRQKSIAYELAGERDLAIAAQQEACAVTDEIASHYEWVDPVQDSLFAALPHNLLQLVPSGKDQTAVRNNFFSLSRLGKLLFAAERRDDAVREWRKAEQLGQDLCDGRDVVDQNVWGLAAIFTERAEIAVFMCEWAKAASLVKQAIKLLEDANVESPGDARTLRSSTSTWQRATEIFDAIESPQREVALGAAQESFSYALQPSRARGYNLPSLRD